MAWRQVTEKTGEATYNMTTLRGSWRAIHKIDRAVGISTVGCEVMGPRSLGEANDLEVSKGAQATGKADRGQDSNLGGSLGQIEV